MMRTLTLAFKIDNGSGSLASPTLKLDSSIATGSLTLKRICVTTPDIHLNRIISIQLPFINRIISNQAIANGIVVAIPGEKISTMTVCDEVYNISNNLVPKQFTVKITDISGDTNASATVPEAYVALTFHTEGYGTL
jgi:hypothetical protein